MTKTSEVGHVQEKAHCPLSILFICVGDVSRETGMYRNEENNSVSMKVNGNHQSGQMLLFVNALLTDTIFQGQWRDLFLNETF